MGSPQGEVTESLGSATYKGSRYVGGLSQLGLMSQFHFESFGSPINPVSLPLPGSPSFM